MTLGYRTPVRSCKLGPGRVDSCSASPAPSSSPIHDYQGFGRSQAQLANAMGTTQSSVSRAERQSDLSALSQYVEAVGAHVHLIVDRDGETIELEMPTGHIKVESPPHEFRINLAGPKSPFTSDA